MPDNSTVTVQNTVYFLPHKLPMSKENTPLNNTVHNNIKNDEQLQGDY